MPESARSSDAVTARLLLVALGFAWGLTWPAMRVALVDFPPLTMRSVATFIGAAAMFFLARIAGRPIGFLPRQMWGYVTILSFFNVIIFSIAAAFAQLNATTGRVAVLVYTMPIWASLMAWLFLHERLSQVRALALLLCVGGMAVLIYPLAEGGIPLGIALALIPSVSWAAGTIYIKGSRISIDPRALAAWQLAVACVVMGVCAVIFESPISLSKAHLNAWIGVIFSGVSGSALAYYLWFRIIRVLPTTTASLGALLSPVIGVISSIFILGEVPTTNDIIGYTLILAAAVCALLQPQMAVPERKPAE